MVLRQYCNHLGQNRLKPFAADEIQNRPYDESILEVDTKGYQLIASVLGKHRARMLCDAMWNIDKLKNGRKLRPLPQVQVKR